MTLTRLNLSPNYRKMKNPLGYITLLAFFLFPLPANSTPPTDPSESDRFFKKVLNFASKDMGNKLVIYIPAINTTPNRGITAGIMPVFLVKDPNSSGIKQLHAPSVTYNRFFGWTGTWRTYLYPHESSKWFLRGSTSQETNRDLTVDYVCSNFLQSNCFLGARFQYTRDGSRRFFGFGPDSKEEDQSNYTMDTWGGHVRFGGYLSHSIIIDGSVGFQFDRVENGPLPTIPKLDAQFPGLSFSARKATLPLRATLTYDTRDNATTPVRGTLLSAFAETVSKSLGSDMSFQTYGGEFRLFIPHNDQNSRISAARILIEQRIGDGIPFYLQSQLGGKKSLRGFGEGRFTDQGRFVMSYEERFRISQLKLMDILTDFEIDPFFELGSVFKRPRTIKLKDIEPAAGVAFRAVVRPQVVGSIDIGIGSEGATTFVNIDYSF